MNDVPEWLKRLNAERTGLWSLAWSTGNSFDAKSLAAFSPREVETAVLNVVTEAGALSFQYKDTVMAASAFAELIGRCGREADEMGRRSIRVVIGNFHVAPTITQCALMKSARAIQEAATHVSWQFVFCGRWSYHAFRSAYLDIHGKTISPPAHFKDVVQVPSWTSEDVLALLSARRVTGAYPSELDRIAAAFLVEQTAGDEFLIGEAVQHVERFGGNWTAHIEQVVNELTDSAVVTSAVNDRIQAIGTKTRAELERLLKVQRLIRGIDSIEAEQLWLAGLARRRDIGSGKQCVHLAGPLINTVVRRILHSQKPGSVALPEDLCFEREAIAAAAYRKISQIEIMLRNLVVAYWHAEVGDKWPERLASIRTLSRDQEEAEDVSQLVSALFQSHLVASGLAPQEPLRPDAAPAAIQPRGDRPQESLLDSALDWQKRQRDHHGVELAHYNLMQFLTTEALMSVLVNKRDGLHGQGKPFSKKEYLVTALEEYIAIRSAVAHNQALKLSTISRLDELHRKFVEWLTVYADQPSPGTVVEPSGGAEQYP